MRLRRRLLCIISFSCITLSFASLAQDENFTLSGIINGMETGQIVLSYKTMNGYKQDTTYLKEGAFNFTGKINEPTLAILSIGSNRIWLEPSQMKIHIDKNKPERLTMTGSKTQQIFDSHNRLIAEIENSALNFAIARNSIRDSLKNPNNYDKKTELEKRYDYFDLLRKQEMKKKDSINMQFIKSNPASFVSAYLLFFFDINELIPLDTLVCIFNNLDTQVQNGFDGQAIKKDIIKKQNNRIGAFAPDFSVLDINNQVISLSSFQGKSIVMLDFWASWCAPCRQGFKTLKPLYNKFHSEGFEIIAIDSDLRGDKENWKNAITTDSISAWYHVPLVVDLRSGRPSEADIYSKYFVQAIPRKILIDRNGIIVGNWEGAGENTEKEVKEVIELLMKQ